ncbi:MAG: bifunctional nuclease family protein [Methanomicrobiales archaeon]|nr:bifunctional nuclease family protein [Methanomicrobiales archaeon]
MPQVKCEVKGVFVAMNDAATVPLVVLSDGTDRVLPIFIGIWEAVSINSAMNHELLPRPFTHDLFIDLCEKCNITLRYLKIDSIEDGVYYAEIVLSTNGRDEFLDCRPSDGIALALRGNVPIFVEDTVLASAGQKSGDLPQIVDLGSFLQK